jgi:indolepyruvate ferredoxin oxidoreductase
MSDGQGVHRDQLTLSGVEALVRLLVVRRELDLSRGLDTAAMISGYPGSPLGGVDLVLEGQRELLTRHRILHQPGVNEELALATAWGSQMGASVAYAGVDGVVGAWYGKTPGLDRSGDVLRHANAQGAGPNGGLVLFCGDDPAAKSSTLPCDSQYTFQDACVPVLYPGDQQEVVELGLHAFELSRHAGPLVGLKIVTSVADGSGSVALTHTLPPTRDLLVDGQVFRHKPLAMIGPHRVPEQELLTSYLRLAAARAYVRQHGLDRTLGEGTRLGIVTSGKTFYDVLQALADLGISRAELTARGLRILKLAMTYPLVEETAIELARAVDNVLVVEEKRPFIETQLRAILHEAGCSVRVVGKRDRAGKPLVAAVGELDAQQVGAVLRRVQPELAPQPHTPKLTLAHPALVPPPRPPEYCSGCPHNRSTIAPAGSLLGGGVGCHGIMYFEPRQGAFQKLPPPPMGAEGVPWIGLAPFVADEHMFQNLGDGTLSHSGILAIRASVAANVNITYKILYNAAVAMTGGQEVAGLLDVPALTRELHAERVARIVVVAEDPDHYGADPSWAPHVTVTGRQQLSEVQDSLRQVKGVSVIVYDQRCASEARRLRRRGLLETPPARVLINEAVCEGCGDCRAKSNCASVLPFPTELGEKRRVDDSSCNRDYTCLEGDCPAFVTLIPSSETKKPAPRRALPSGTLPAPAPAASRPHFGVYFTGIGGTGVVTAGRMLASAAEAAGLTVSRLDQTGLAQRGGAVVSHIHFARDRLQLAAAAIGAQGADLYLSGDIFQAANPSHLTRVRHGQTIAVVDTHIAPTASMQQTGQAAPSSAALQAAINERVGSERIVFVDAQRIAEQVFGQHVLANVVLLGAAFQRGALPLTLSHIEAGFAGKTNREAFAWGRWAAHDPHAVEAALAGGTEPLSPFEPSAEASAEAATLLAKLTGVPSDVTPLLLRRTAQVIDYQNSALAQRYLALVQRALEQDSSAQHWQLTRAVAESWHRLLTYKDEYEVARLHRRTDYGRLARQLGIEGAYALQYHLHPPFLRRLGLKHKIKLGWLFALTFMLLRPLKVLRGTWLDVFGWDRDRRLERKLIGEYRALMERALATPRMSYDTRVELAASALSIKGYAEVKDRRVALWRQRVAELAGSSG